MKINSISLKNYRNIENLNLTFDDVNIIWGENAQGKTNLLEAIYLFSGAKSFRGVKDKDLIKFNCDKSDLKIDFTNNDREQTAEIIIDNKRHALLNDIKKKSASCLGEEIKVVIFSPVHLSMIKNGPIERRNFVDGALCQLKYNYRNLIKEYNKALTQRNTLLKDIARNSSLESMLYVWNDQLVKAGAKIIYQRLKYLEALSPFVEEIFDGISGGKEKIELKYLGKADYKADIKDIEHKLSMLYINNQGIDIINRITTIGPHRDDIEILINGKSARTYGSQGQQRSCVLAMKLAEASLLKEMTNNEPIALLDDVMSELDEKRQDYILNHIKNWQVFITCCDANTILRLKKGKTFHIDNGKMVEN